MTELPATFGKYFLTEKLATGGMAEIYLAKLVGPGGFEKQLVIKQIHPKLTGQRHFVDLFVAEAKTLVTLAHGNIVPVYELGVIDDTYFIAMEYIDGPTLYRLTEALARRDARMEPAVAAWIASKILEGLDYAHRKGEGVIHRDLSPRNVMLSRDGEVKLVDFGIAVTLGATDDSKVQSAPTGSFPYMSPEQVRREPLTGQTDLFSVGVLLWEMLVGHRLFARPDPDATLAAVTGGEIARPSIARTRGERPEVPPKLDEVVMKALERDRAARWQSAEDMLAALQRYLYGLDETPGPRDVAALVARHCPPETRRIPTHADIVGDDGAAVPSPAGPRTAVIEREGAKPRGKQRARTETFATHVDLKNMLERATPLFPIQAITDEPPRGDATPPTPERAAERGDATPPTPERAAERGDATPARSQRLASVRDDATPARSQRMASVRDDAREPIGRRPPSRAGIVLAAVGTIILGIAAIYVFNKGKGAVMRPDAMPKYDAPYYAFEPDARGAPPPDAPELVDAAEVPVDAALADARPEPPRDAGVRMVRDASTAPPPDAAVVVTGTSTLEIGAKPWAEITVDGVSRDRTPKRIELPAGKHVVELVYSGDTPPTKKSFTVTVGIGKTETVFHDFTKP